MKTISLRFLVITGIVLVVIAGGSRPSLPDLDRFFKPPAPAPSAFAAAHAGLAIPAVDAAEIDCRNGREHDVPVPAELFLRDYEKKLYDFVLHRRYAGLDWCVDKRVRDTGPWVQGASYGTHPSVRIHYSPRMMYWLTGDPGYWQEGKRSGAAKPQPPRTGEVPEGAMIVKEMFMPPAEIYAEVEMLMAQETGAGCRNGQAFDSLLTRLITAYTVMVKAGDGAADGWFWAEVAAPKPVGGKLQTIAEAIDAQLSDYSNMSGAGFGLTCIRCHASADKQLTFSALRNIKGFMPGENLLDFRDDNSWRSKNYFENYPLSLLGMDRTCLADSAVRRLFELPAALRPWTAEEEPDWAEFMRFHLPEGKPAGKPGDRSPRSDIHPDFAAAFPPPPGLTASGVQAFPSQWADHVVPGKRLRQYLTSDNCMGCHGGLGGNPFGVTMFVQTGPDYGEGYNISEYGEWRWSPMGLAGRDPIFYAQLESEMALLDRDARQGGLLIGSLKDNREQVVNTCLSCHGSMGQRQLAIDARTDKSLDPNFRVDYVYLVEALSAADKKPEAYPYHEYGELAREGVSCATCHHIAAPDADSVNHWRPANPGWVNKKTPRELAYFLFHNTTGRFSSGPPNTLGGPFAQVAALPMQNALGITPKYDAFIAQSEMCGSCHTINLPNIGMTVDKFPVLTAAEQNPVLRSYPHTIEQETFLEWQNSSFAATVAGRPGPGFQSCQDCHMPAGFASLDGRIDIPRITTKIATIQDTDYPEADHRAPDPEIRLPERPDYRRHEHVGLNVFLLEMFNQFPDVLGVAKHDFMTSATSGNALAIDNMVRQARTATVDLDVKVQPLLGRQLTVDVEVRNKTGHRFPSGVEFRRAFLELLVLDAGGRVVWASGRTNSAGVILGPDGLPLPTEFLPDRTAFQPHYQVINRQDQVQIYEELTQDAAFDFTTSFIHRVHEIKDNRLLPRGWRSSEHFRDLGDVLFEFMAATDPHVEGDPDYEDQGPRFPGLDRLQYRPTLPDGVDPDGLTVRVAMYYQSIPPYYLRQRFTTAPDGPATRRLYYLTSRLNLKGTAMEDWKLPLVQSALRWNEKLKKWENAK